MNKIIKHVFPEFSPSNSLGLINKYDLNEMHKLLFTYGVSAVHEGLSNRDGIRIGSVYFKTDVVNGFV